MIERRPAFFWLGCGLLSLFITAAALAPVLAPHDPRRLVGTPFGAPTQAHPLGTNGLGQDVLSQLIYGTRTTLLVAGAVTVISAMLSWLVGLLAGACRRAETPLMAITDLLLALPNLPLYLLVLTMVGPSRGNVALTLGLVSWPAFARIVRSIVIRTRVAPYVEASRALGASPLHILRRHLLPATLVVLPTKLILTVRFAILAEATLAFLGLSGHHSVSWGTMVNWAYSDPLLFARPTWPWLVLPPMLAIISFLLATVWVSNGITTALERSSWSPHKPAVITTRPPQGTRALHLGQTRG